MQSFGTVTFESFVAPPSSEIQQPFLSSFGRIVPPSSFLSRDWTASLAFRISSAPHRTNTMYYPRGLVVFVFLSLSVILLSSNCDMAGPAFVVLGIDSTTGEYTFARDFSANESNAKARKKRNLLDVTPEELDASTRLLRNGWLSKISTNPRHSNRGLEGDGDRNDSIAIESSLGQNIESDNITVEFQAMECPYSEGNLTYYCPLVEDAKVACVQSVAGQEPQCHLSVQNSQAKVVLYLAMVWMTMSCIPFVITQEGRSAFEFPLAWCFKGWTKRRVDQMLTSDPARAARMIRDYEERRLAEAGIQETQPTWRRRGRRNGQQPTSLVLSTKTHITKTVEDKGVVSEVVDCSICLAPLMNNDRVGKLNCNHVFHVECLKAWVRHRNSCPLCQAKDIASPHFHQNAVASALCTRRNLHRQHTASTEVSEVTVRPH